MLDAKVSTVEGGLFPRKRTNQSSDHPSALIVNSALQRQISLQLASISHESNITREITKILTQQTSPH